MCDALLGKLKTLEAQPEQVKLEIGIRFSAQGGLIIASGKMGASLKATVTWKKPRQPKPRSRVAAST